MQLDFDPLPQVMGITTLIDPACIMIRPVVGSIYVGRFPGTGRKPAGADGCWPAGH